MIRIVQGLGLRISGLPASGRRLLDQLLGLGGRGIEGPHYLALNSSLPGGLPDAAGGNY